MFLNKIKKINKKEAIQVSVIIPIYNSENYLNSCLDSVCNQTLHNIEIICIDDCSTDSTMSILEKYSKNDKRIKIIKNKNNLGPGASRNIGVNMARGKYIMFVDSDDWMDKETLEYTYNKSKENNLDILIFKLDIFDELNQKSIKNDVYSVKVLDNYNNTIFNHENLDSDTLFKIPVTSYGKLFLKSFIEKYDLKFKENTIFEDNSFFIKSILNAKSISIIDKFFYHRRIRSNSIMSSKDARHIDIIKVREDILNLISSNTSNYDKYHKSFYNHMFHSFINGFYKIDSEYKNDYFRALKKFIYKCIVEYDLNNDITNSLTKNNLEFYNLVILSIKTDNTKLKSIKNNIKLNNPLDIIVRCDEITTNEVYTLINSLITQTIDFSFINITLIDNGNIDTQIKTLLTKLDDIYYNINYIHLNNECNIVDEYNYAIKHTNKNYIILTDKNHTYPPNYIRNIFKSFRNNNLNMYTMDEKNSELNSFIIHNKIFKREFIIKTNNPIIKYKENKVLLNPTIYDKETQDVKYSELIEVIEYMLKTNDYNKFYDDMINTLKNNFINAQPKIKNEYFNMLKNFINKCVVEYDLNITDSLTKNNLEFYNLVILSIKTDNTKLESIKNNIKLNNPLDIIVQCDEITTNEVYTLINSLITQTIDFSFINVTLIDSGNIDTQIKTLLTKLDDIYYNINYIHLNNECNIVNEYDYAIKHTNKNYIILTDKNHTYPPNYIRNIFKSFRDNNLNIYTMDEKNSELNSFIIHNKIFKRDFLIKTNNPIIKYKENKVLLNPTIYDKETQDVKYSELIEVIEYMLKTNDYNEFYDDMINTLKNNFINAHPKIKNEYFNMLKNFINKCVVEYDLNITDSLTKNNLEFYNLVMLSIKTDNAKLESIKNNIKLNNPLDIIVQCDEITTNGVYTLINSLITQTIDFSFINVTLIDSGNIDTQIKTLLTKLDDIYYNINYIHLNNECNIVDEYNYAIKHTNKNYIILTDKDHTYPPNYIRNIFKSFRDNNLNMYTMNEKNSELNSFIIHNKIFKRDFLIKTNNPIIKYKENKVLLNPTIYDKETQNIKYSELIEVIEYMLKNENYHKYDDMISTLKNNFINAHPKIKNEYFNMLKNFIHKCVVEYNINDEIRLHLTKNNLMFYNFIIMSLKNNDLKRIQNEIILDIPVSIIIYCEDNPSNELNNMLNTIIKQSIGFNMIEIVFVNNSSNNKTCEKIIEFEELYYNVNYIQLDNNVSKTEALNIGINNSSAQYLMFMDKDHIFLNSSVKNIFKAIRKGNMNVASGTIVKSKTPSNNTFIWTKIFKRKFIENTNISFILCVDNDICVEAKMYNEKGIIEVDIPIIK